MRQNKKVVSLMVVFAMIMTMLSSMIVVNAAGTEIYTKIEKTSDTTATLTVGYTGLGETGSIEGFELQVPVPAGFTATNENITVSTDFAGSIPNVKDNVIKVQGSNATGFKAGDANVILTAELTMTAPTETTTYDFVASVFDADLVGGTSISLTDSTVTAKKSSLTVEVEVTGPAVYVSDATVVDGAATVEIGYKNFDAATSIEGFELQVPIPNGLTATNENITVSTDFAGSIPNIKDNVIKVQGSNATGFKAGSENVIITVVFAVDATVEDGTVISIVPTVFDADLVGGTSVSLTDKSVGAISGKVSVGGSEPTTSPEPSTSPEPGDNKINSVTLDATSKAAKKGDTVTFNVTVDGTGKKTVTATAKLGDADVAVDVKGSVVTVTVPSDAVEGDKIELVVTSAVDATKFAKATITVIDPVIDIKPAKKIETSMNGGKVTTFAVNIAAIAGKDVAAKFVADQTYRVVFDYTKEDGTTVGNNFISIKGAQVKLLAEGDTSVEVCGSNIGAEAATIHFEDSTGKVIQ